MFLTGFEVTNYRSIVDSGWIECSNLECLVGKNESGKTSLLKALWKFNPSSDFPKYNSEKEWPRDRRSSVDEDARVVRCRFKFTEEEGNIFLENDLPFCRSVLISKRYNGKYGFTFEPDQLATSHSIEYLLNAIEDNNWSHTEVEGAVSFEFDGLRKEAFSELVDAVVDKVSVPELLKIANNIPQSIKKWLSDNNPSDGDLALSVSISESIKSITASWSSLTPFQKGVNLVKDWIPTFIYMDNYRAFSGSAFLDEVKNRIDSGEQNLSDETIIMIMKEAGLDIDQEVERGQVLNREQRMLDMRDAGATLTNKLSKHWSQKDFSIECTIDGHHFMMFILDDRAGGLVPLEERSKGFQWFFSFNMMFMAETNGSYRNAILLLDEPGLHLHAEAQKDLLNRLLAYADSNQLIYTTHLPFMIDPNRLDHVHVCEETDKGCKVHCNWQSASNDSRFTLQAALGLTWSQSLFVGMHNLVVEGVTDYWYLKMLSAFISLVDTGGLDERLVITPAGGASKVTYLAALLNGQGANVCVLLDGDPEGLKSYNEIVKSWILKDKLVVSLNEVLGSENPCAIEDLFSREFYIKEVAESYKSELGRKKLVLKGDTNDSIVKRLSLCLEEKIGTRLNKGRVAKNIMDKFRCEDDFEFDQATVDNFKALFEKLNGIVESWSNSNT